MEPLENLGLNGKIELEIGCESLYVINLYHNKVHWQTVRTW
jgi:hypothetical protein